MILVCVMDREQAVCGNLEHERLEKILEFSADKR